MKTALKLLFILMSIIGYSQEFSMDLVKNMNPRNIGQFYNLHQPHFSFCAQEKEIVLQL